MTSRQDKEQREQPQDQPRRDQEGSGEGSASAWTRLKQVERRRAELNEGVRRKPAAGNSAE